MSRLIAPLLCMALGLAFSGVSYAQVEQSAFTEGTGYRVLDEPVEVNNPDQVEVREFFFYGCPHCFNVEPAVEQWRRNQPDDVNFVRTPVLFLKGGEPLARAFYVARNQDLLDSIHEPLFKAIHEKHKRLFTESKLAGFFDEHGLDREQFNELYSSFGVTTKVRQAKAVTRNYQIRGVPAFTVGGRYVVLRKNLDGEQQTLEVIDYLVDKVRNKRQ